MKTITLILLTLLTTAATLGSNSYLDTEKTIASTALNSSFSFYRTHRQGNVGIMNTWAMQSETGITSYIVERTYEDPNDPYAVWEIVDVQAASGKKSYKFHNLNVFPGYISYRITAEKTNGSNVISQVNTIHIVAH